MFTANGHREKSITSIINGKIINLGYYATEAEARAVFIAKHIQVHGEFSPFVLKDQSE